MSVRLALAACALLAATSTAAYAGSVRMGMMLTDEKGMTLYTFDKDEMGKSNCVDACAQNWPPLMAGADAKPEGDMTIIMRADGGKQWAHKGKPLYLWMKDMKPGDATGDGVKDVWHVAKP